MRGSRVIATVLLFLGGGTVVSLLAAAACAAWPPPAYTVHTMSGSMLEPGKTRWSDTLNGTRFPPDGTHGAVRDRVLPTLQSWLDRDPDTRLTYGFTTWVTRSPGRRLERATLAPLGVQPAPGPPPRGWSASRLTVGWPVPCLESRDNPAGSQPPADAVPIPAWASPVTDPSCPQSALLPLRPLPAGLTADAALFGALLFAVVRTPRALRALRRRRYQCPACGYDRRGLAAGAPCPECGPLAA